MTQDQQVRMDPRDLQDRKVNKDSQVHKVQQEMQAHLVRRDRKAILVHQETLEILDLKDNPEHLAFLEPLVRRDKGASGRLVHLVLPVQLDRLVPPVSQVLKEQQDSLAQLEI